MKFTKTKTSVSMDGQLNEVRVAALLFLRCKTSPTVSQFQLATNAAIGGEKLDDVILRYKTFDEPDIWRTCFLQLKKTGKKTLSDTVLSGNSKDFGLKNYVESFAYIKKAMSVDNKEELLNGLFEDCKFILFTNASAVGRLTERTEGGSLGEIETLLKSESECASILGFREERDKVIYAAVETDDGKEFLQKIKVFSGQPTPDQLELLIKKELKTGDDVVDKYTDMLYDCYEKSVKEWWENSDELLDESSDFYDRALEKVRLFHMNVLSAREKSQASFVVRFKDLEPLKDDFDCELLHVIALEPSLKLACTKLLQFLQPDAFTFFRLKCLQREQERVLPVWKSNEDCPWLVIFSKSTEDCSELGDKICKILLENNRKRIAVVSQKCDQFTCYLKTQLKNNYKELEECSKASQLEEGTLMKLTETNVSFQGCLVDFKSIYNKNDSLLEDIVLDDSLLDSFIRNKTPVVGNALIGDSSYFIPRTLLNYTVLDKKVFAANLKGTIAVSGVSPQEIQSLEPPRARASLTTGNDGHDVRKFVILDSDDSERGWRESCEVVNGAHWIQKHGDHFVFHKSNGHIDEIRPYIDEAWRLLYDIDDCLNVNQRSVLLEGEPGMGKTTITTHLAGHTKSAHPSFWVICINLVEYTNLLKETHSCPVEFLASSLGLAGSPFATSLLKQSVERVGNVVVILDGFDEISPTYEQEGCRLITELLKTKVTKLWVTSRFFIKERVEREMFVFAMKLQEFSIENQIDFITKFWKEKVGCNFQSDVELKISINQLLAKVSESLNDREKCFTGIPLQTMMLAEVFSDYAANPTKYQIPKKLDLLYLFEEFVEKKFQIYIRKLWPDGNMVINFVLNEMRTNFNQKHMYASLVYLLPPEWLEKLHSYEEIMRMAEKFVKDVETGEDKTGIVDSIVQGRPKFIHRCFAEFYGAQFFFTSYKQNKEFLRDYIFHGFFPVVHQIFNNLLTRQLPLHAAVLCNDVELAKRLLQHTDVNSVDLGGRSALHLASGYNLDLKGASFEGVVNGMPYPDTMRNRDSILFGPKQQHIVDLLINKGADVNMVDSVLEWTPLQYAVHAQNWDAADILLSKNANPTEFIYPEFDSSLWSSIIDEGHVSLMKCIVDQGLFAGDHPDNYCIVQRSIINGHLKLVKLLVSNSEHVLLPRLERRTFLHQAARCGQTSILNYLLGILKREIGEVRCAESINSLDESGYTAMHLACQNGFLDIVTLLSKSGGDLKSLDEHRVHLLQNASWRGFFSVVKFIIDSFGNDSELIKECINFENPQGMNSVDCASLHDHSEIVKYLVENGGSPQGSSFSSLMANSYYDNPLDLQPLNSCHSGVFFE